MRYTRRHGARTTRIPGGARAVAVLLSLLAGALWLPTPLASAASGATSDRIAFGIQPAENGKPDARPNYRYAVTPGARVSDQVAVRNVGTVPITVRVYSTDAVNDPDGGFSLPPRATRARDVGRWLVLAGRTTPSVLRLQPRSFRVLPVLMSVPTNAQPGDHAGAIVVSVSTRTRNAQGTNVELEQRVGVRVFARVSGPQRPELTVQQLTARFDGTWNGMRPGVTDVSYRVTNTGNINLGGRQRITVKGLVGGARTMSPADVPLLLPGSSVMVTERVRGTWPLLRERITVRVTPLPLVDDPVAVRPAVASTSLWVVPWALLSVLLVLLLVVAGLLVRRHRRRRRRPLPASRGAHRPASAQTRAAAQEPVGTARRLAAATGGILACILGLGLAGAGTAQASTDVPYNDVEAVGGITLCDAAGRQITSGSSSARPVAARAVGGVAAVAPYDAKGATAGLYAFQPRRQVSAQEWSGQALTAMSRYSSRRYPMVEGLPRDYSVDDFLAAYPAQWDGLVQLRIYLRAPDQAANGLQYAATTLRVQGSTWTQIGPDAGASCSKGKATSVIRLLGLPVDRPAGQQTAAAAGSTGQPTASARPSAAPSGTSLLPSEAATTVPGSGGPTPAAVADRPAGDGAPQWARPMLAVAVLALLGGLAMVAPRLRRNHSVPNGS